MLVFGLELFLSHGCAAGHVKFALARWKLNPLGRILMARLCIG